MAPIDMRRYNTYTCEILSVPSTQPSGFTPQRPTGLLSCDRPMAAHPLVVSNNNQTFPILPKQLEKHLEHVQERYDIPPQVFPASGSIPSPTLGEKLVLNPPPEMVPAIYAFQASAFGMPSVEQYARFLTRYLDEMVPNRQGKALIDWELLERIKLVLDFQHNDFCGSDKRNYDFDSAHGTPCGAGGSWDTPSFRRWVRRTFVYRQATQAELERAIDFGLLAPPYSSLSGPGVVGRAPSTCLSHSMNLVFHQDRPIALRSRIYRVILRAHWITNHAGRDRTWAMVQEVCSYIPKRLVHDFVSACPTCRVARSGQYEAHTRTSREISMGGEKLHNGSKPQDGKKDRTAEPILSMPLQWASLGGWIPSVGNSDPHHLYHTQMSAGAPIIVDSSPDLLSGSAKLSPPISRNLEERMLAMGSR